MTENYVRLKTLEELNTFIKDELDKNHDYNSAVDVMWKVALAAFEFAAAEVGASGFQASCAELMFLAKSRRIEGPFAVIKADDLLYSKYYISNTVADYINEWMPWASEQAKIKLKTNKKEQVAPKVWEHWQTLAAYTK